MINQQNCGKIVNTVGRLEMIEKMMVKSDWKDRIVKLDEKV